MRAADGMLTGVRFDRERMAAAAADELLAATDVADLLVRRGVPFRESHGVVAGLVRGALERGVAPSALSEDDLRDLAPALAPADLVAVLREGATLESKASQGGTALSRVREQLAAARAELAGPPG
ncbi:MAG: Argininosuccinate lyase [uncultured Solirubrobacterales bacterium]|uniref:Argininosuccinate lyase n=1 Tax=uncultured Solirubrobacterales bacterium TaxID=768556 RepID=A0A6J4SUE9_9ACTN|nr:MAG: Argininosuccinate lyase [uncultured Solirubrobacterales bacterium]